MKNNLTTNRTRHMNQVLMFITIALADQRKYFTLLCCKLFRKIQTPFSLYSKCVGNVNIIHSDIEIDDHVAIVCS